MRCLRCKKIIKAKKSKSGKIIIYCNKCIKETGITLVAEIERRK